MTQPLEQPEPLDPPELEDAPIDLAGLLVALVLVPQSYPRNRFFELYREPGAHRVRRRAALLRGLITDLRGEAAGVTLERCVSSARDDAVLLRYRLDELGVTRTSRLDTLELAVLKLVLDRTGDAHALGAVDDDALARVRPHLLRLFDREA